MTDVLTAATATAATIRLAEMGSRTYRRSHDRVRAVLGKASRHRCSDCGGRARDWSLSARDECQGNLLDVPVVTDRGTIEHRVVSDRIGDYVPRCTRDHKRHDVEEQRRFLASFADAEPYAEGI